MEQLEDAQRRPSQRQRRRDGVVLREPGGLRANRSGLGKRTLGNLTSRAEIGGDFDVPRRAEDEAVVAALPENGAGGAGQAGGEPDHLHRGVLLVQRRRQRLTGELERRAGERGRVPAGREGAKDESRLGGAQLCGEPLLRTERISRSEQLERDLGAVGTCRDEEHLLGAGPFRDPAHRVRHAGELVDRGFGEVRRRKDGSLQLGGERVRRRDRDGLEPLGAVVEGANERDLCARHRPRSLGQRLQRV